MRILADRHIPWVEEAFGPYGELVLKERFEPEDLPGAQVLLVRSIQPVDSRLLARAADLKFVGTATAGLDHIDQAYLKAHHIAFANAPGCNALAVAQWVVAALVRHYGDFETLSAKRLGIVGLGEVGGRLRSLALQLGMQVKASDPPKQQAGAEGPWLPLEELLEQSDILTLHVPLTVEGPHPTMGLLVEEQLKRLPKNAVLINSSRGGVVDEEAIKAVSPRLDGLILDCWKNEPHIDRALLELTTQASPHVAGYSLEAKIKGTTQVQEALARHFGLVPHPWLPKLNHFRADAGMGLRPLMDLIAGLSRDDAALRQGGDFKALRDHYPLRREWASVELGGAEHLSDREADRLAALGFRLV